jgi:hypothetical protein
MGSIFGLALTRGNVVKNKTLVRSIIYSLMTSAKKSDSNESSGLAITTDTGVTLVRKACDVNDFFSTPTISEAIEKSLCVDNPARKLLSVLGHCHTSKGNYAVELEDMHPVHRGHVVGTYGGYVFNPEVLMKTHSLKRNGVYAGELFFSLISHLYKKYHSTVKLPFTMAMEEAAETTVGPISAACMCTDNPYMLWFAKTNLTIAIRNYYNTGIILFSEADHHLTSAAAAWSLGPYEVVAFEANSILGIDLCGNSVIRKKIAAKII